MRTACEVRVMQFPALLTDVKSDYYAIRGLTATCCDPITFGHIRRMCLQALRDGIPRNQVASALSEGVTELHNNASMYKDIAVQLATLPTNCFNGLMEIVLGHRN